jgi:hypothetical protein
MGLFKASMNLAATPWQEQILVATLQVKGKRVVCNHATPEWSRSSQWSVSSLQ